MPVKFPNGLEIINVTTHDLHFWIGDERGVLIVPPEGRIYGAPINRTVAKRSTHTLTTLSYTETASGRETLENFKARYPDALVVGSTIAAQAFPEEVVAPIPLRTERGVREDRSLRLVRSDRFTVFLKENQSNG